MGTVKLTEQQAKDLLHLVQQESCDDELEKVLKAAIKDSVEKRWQEAQIVIVHQR